MADLDMEELERLANELGSDCLAPFLTDVGRSMRTEALADAIPALIAEVRRLRAEVERRPDVSPEDARGWYVAEMANFCDPSINEKHAWERVTEALRAHAAKVKP